MILADSHSIDDQLDDHPQCHSARSTYPSRQRLQSSAEAAEVAVVAFDLPAQVVKLWSQRRQRARQRQAWWLQQLNAPQSKPRMIAMAQCRGRLFAWRQQQQAAGAGELVQHVGVVRRVGRQITAS